MSNEKYNFQLPIVRLMFILVSGVSRNLSSAVTGIG